MGHCAHEGGGEELELVVSVGVVAVGRSRGQRHADEEHDVVEGFGGGVEAVGAQGEGSAPGPVEHLRDGDDDVEPERQRTRRIALVRSLGVSGVESSRVAPADR